MILIWFVCNLLVLYDRFFHYIVQILLLEEADDDMTEFLRQFLL